MLSWLSYQEPAYEAALRNRRFAWWLGFSPSTSRDGKQPGKHAPNQKQTAPELPKLAGNCGSLEADSSAGRPVTRQPRSPLAGAPHAGFLGTAERVEPEARELSASLHRPRQREGGSGEGATQTVALGKLRPQFFQVCPSKRREVGAPLGGMPPRSGHP